MTDKTLPYLVTLYDSEQDEELFWQYPVEFNELSNMLTVYCGMGKARRRKFYDELHTKGEAFYSPREGTKLAHNHISVRSLSTVHLTQEVEKLAEAEAKESKQVFTTFAEGSKRPIDEPSEYPYLVSIYDQKSRLQIIANADVNAKGLSEILKKFCGLNYEKRRNFTYVLENAGMVQHKAEEGHARWTFDVLVLRAARR